MTTQSHTPDPTRRFADRVDNYIRYRPGYPAQLLTFLRDEIGLAPSMVIADIGSGTGISCVPFLDLGNTVYGIEPNDEMRLASNRILSRYPNFHSVAGRAEQTGLDACSIDLITAMQAFHWFDPPAARAEFGRILKPDGWVVLVWNERRTEATEFLRHYERLLLEFATDYQKVRHENVTPDRLAAFFAGTFTTRCFENVQAFDYAGLEGRLLSSSYAPGPEDSRHHPMLTRLRALFSEHRRDGEVKFEYDTRVYLGRLG